MLLYYCCRALYTIIQLLYCYYYGTRHLFSVTCSHSGPNLRCARMRVLLLMLRVVGGKEVDRLAR